MPARRILVVDDDANMREIMAQRLMPLGYQVEVSPDGRTAASRLQVEEFDLVLLDLIMSAGPGTTVIEALEALPFPPACIIISGVGELWERYYNGAAKYPVLQKPVDFNKLLELIGAAFA